MKLHPWHHHPGVETDHLPLGDRAADRMRNIMGSWPFVFGFLATMGVWAFTNTELIGKIAHGKPFDPYPYILLNLFLSMLAGLQGAILLIAAKRADGIAAQQAIHHLQVSEGMSGVLAEVKTDTALLQEIHRHVSGENGHFAPDETPEPEGDAPDLITVTKRLRWACDDTVADSEWDAAWEQWFAVTEKWKHPNS